MVHWFHMAMGRGRRLAAYAADELPAAEHSRVEADLHSCPACRREVEAQRARDEPTVPSTLARELRINPFLRSAVPEVRTMVEKHAGISLPDSVSVFAAVRRWKDNFSG